MKRVYIIHGWGGSPDEPLHKWLASELTREGLEVEVPKMPNSDEPVIEEWIAKLHEIVGPKLDKNFIFIGHSIGCQTILRYLASINSSEQAGGVVFIAPWIYLSGLGTEEEQEIAKPWIEEEIDKPKVFRHLPKNKRVAIFSDNDPYVPLDQTDWFEEGLGFEIVIEHNKGHFTKDDGVNSLPSALRAIRRMNKPA